MSSFCPLLFLYCFQTFGYVSWNSPENSPLFCSMAMLGSWCCVMMQSTLTHSSQGIHNFLSFPSWSQNEVKFYWFYWLYTDIHEKEKKWILLVLWLQTGTEVERIEKVLPCCTAGSRILMEEMKDRDVYIKNSSHGYHVLKHNQPWPQRQQANNEAEPASPPQLMPHLPTTTTNVHEIGLQSQVLETNHGWSSAGIGTSSNQRPGALVFRSSLAPGIDCWPMKKAL